MLNNGKKIGWLSAASIVVANMVGTGVFTSLGFQLEDIQNTWSIVLLWSFGGLFSILGAFSYAELGTKLPKSGGEYHFLSETIHPFVGYLSGWVSLTVGFSAPVALAAMAMGSYVAKFMWLSPTLIGAITVVIISAIHSINIRQSSRFQNVFTALKLLLIAGIVLLGLIHTPSANSINLDAGWKVEIFLPAYAVAFVYVTYSYSGWNAAAYIIEEIKVPRINLPKALIGGTLVVSILFILLQVAFLNQAPIHALKGKVEIGQIVAEYMFGPEGGKLISLIIALLLISSISAMIWVGPRVTRAMASDYPLWQFLSKDNKNGIPVSAIWFQSIISLLLIITGSFELVLLYSGFILQIFTMLTIAGVFILRMKKIGIAGYNSPGYPYFQILYLLLSIWIISFLLYDKPEESLLGLLNLLLGALTFLLNKAKIRAG